MLQTGVVVMPNDMYHILTPWAAATAIHVVLLDSFVTVRLIVDCPMDFVAVRRSAAWIVLHIQCFQVLVGFHCMNDE